jgi:putative ABC transport system permease protein
VANLLLVPTSLRSRELAVRTALGGSWWRLARQMLSEALVLAGIGSLLGAGLAWLGIHELRVIAPANLPRLESIAIDATVLAFTAMAGLAAAAIFGGARTLACRVGTPADTLCGRQASRRVSTQHARVRAPHYRTNR